MLPRNRGRLGDSGAGLSGPDPASRGLAQLAERRFGRAFRRGPSKSNIVSESRTGLGPFELDDDVEAGRLSAIWVSSGSNARFA